MLCAHFETKCVKKSESVTHIFGSQEVVKNLTITSNSSVAMVLDVWQCRFVHRHGKLILITDYSHYQMVLMTPRFVITICLPRNVCEQNGNAKCLAIPFFEACGR
jgi:hypothetical protein